MGGQLGGGNLVGGEVEGDATGAIAGVVEKDGDGLASGCGLCGPALDKLFGGLLQHDADEACGGSEAVLCLNEVDCRPHLVCRERFQRVPGHEGSFCSVRLGCTTREVKRGARSQTVASIYIARCEIACECDWELAKDLCAKAVHAAAMGAEIGGAVEQGKGFGGAGFAGAEEWLGRGRRS